MAGGFAASRDGTTGHGAHIVIILAAMMSPYFLPPLTASFRPPGVARANGLLSARQAPLGFHFLDAGAGRSAQALAFAIGQAWQELFDARLRQQRLSYRRLASVYAAADRLMSLKAMSARRRPSWTRDACIAP